jgi:hypothetical protein
MRVTIPPLPTYLHGVPRENLQEVYKTKHRAEIKENDERGIREPKRPAGNSEV